MRSRFGFHQRITVIALTGGPSAGKTSVLAAIKQWLENRGFKVAILAEVATELISVGFPPFPEYWPNDSAFQYHVLMYSLDRENRYHEMLEDFKTDKPMVLIADRGTLDGMAYIGRQTYLQLLESQNIDLHSLRERYKAVIHLETAAASKGYTRDNNPSRSEDPLEALERDTKTWEAWLGHQHHIRIPAQEDFDQKKLNVLKSLSRIIGMPEPFEIERKWRIDHFDPNMFPATAGAVEILQTYLRSEAGSERRVRMRTSDGSSSYYMTTKFPTYSGIKRIEKERQIIRSEYETLLLEADLECSPIRKTRYSIEYDNRTLEYDIYQDIPGLAVLEIELPTEDAKVNLPTDAKYVEVTNDRTYKNRAIAEALKRGTAQELVVRS